MSEFKKMVQVTPELSTLAETCETVSSCSGSSSANTNKIPVSVPPSAAVCNGPKKIGGWGRLKARAASEEPDQSQQSATVTSVPTSVTSVIPVTSSTPAVTSASSSLSPSPVVPADSPVRVVPEIRLRTGEGDDGGGGEMPAKQPGVVIVPVSEWAGETSVPVPENAAKTKTTLSQKGEQGLVDPSEMLVSLQQFKVNKFCGCIEKSHIQGVR
jgi:hypothetical protein